MKVVGVPRMIVRGLAAASACIGKSSHWWKWTLQLQPTMVVIEVADRFVRERSSMEVPERSPAERVGRPQGVDETGCERPVREELAKLRELDRRDWNCQNQQRLIDSSHVTI